MTFDLDMFVSIWSLVTAVGLIWFIMISKGFRNALERAQKAGFNPFVLHFSASAIAGSLILAALAQLFIDPNVKPTLIFLAAPLLIWQLWELNHALQNPESAHQKEA